MKGKTLLLSLFKTKKMSGKAKALTALSALFLGGFFVAHTLLAAVTVTPATGGTNISIDTTSAMGGTATYTAFGSVTGPLITESSVGQITAGTHVLSLPAGWEFNTSQNVTIGIGGGSNLTLTAQVVTPAATSLSFNVSSVSSNSPATLNFSGIQVRPTGTVVSSGNMTHSGAAISDVTDGVTNFGTFSTTAGAVKQLGFATQPANITYGSNVSNTVVRTQDQFGNNSVVGLAAGSNVTITLQSGSGALTGTVLQDIGTSAGNGILTYSNLYIDNVGAKVLRATGTGLTINTVDSNSFTINQKSLTSTITASNKVYDGNASATIMTRTPVGVVGGDTVTVNGGTATFADKNVANGKVVTATGMTLGDTDAAKYSFDGIGAGTADITQLAITITPTAAQTKVYGNADPVFAYGLSTPLVGGDTATGALARATGENIGMYAIDQGTLSIGSNYALTFTAGVNFTITARPITVTGAANTKVYDQGISSATTPTITAGTLAFTDTASFTQVYDTALVGINKTMTPSGLVNDGNGGNNYSYTFTPANVGVITQKGLDVTGLSAPSKVYDQGTSATIMGVPALSGIIAPDVVTIGGVAAGNHNTANVGATTVTVTGLSLGGADMANYSINPIVLNSSITAYPVTVTVTPAQTKVYGTADPAFTYGSTGLLAGDNFSGALDRVAGENIGSYAIGQGTLTAGTNYNITFVADNFTVTAKPITLTVTPAQTKVFGNADPVFAYTFNTALIGGDTATGALARAAGENIGSYAINQGTVTLGANYTITFVADNFTITAKPITVTPDAGQSKIYGTADPVFTYTFS
ncbi:MAG TPA: MBG domain-containing protein, partial [bacterium]|nr:MBG domain-containing protein [bacterium]